MSFNLEVQSFINSVHQSKHRPPLPEFILQCSRLELMGLALANPDCLEELDRLYPEFLADKVTCYDDLNLFCQVLKDNWQRLLTSPKVKKFIPQDRMAIGITNNNLMLISERDNLAVQLIKTLDELVYICSCNHYYLKLVVYPEFNVRTRKFEPQLGPLGHLITNQTDLARLAFLDQQFMYRVYRCPELSNLIVNQPLWCYQASQYQDPMVQKSYPPERKSSLAYGLFSEYVKPRAPLFNLPNPSGESVMTMGEFMGFTQFDPTCGYYSAGAIQFTKESSQGHYATEASDHVTLAVSLAIRAFQCWASLPEAERTPFEILEIGAGEGDLCKQIFRFIDEKATRETAWHEFAKAVHYTIIEKAPPLIERQKELLLKPLENGRVSILAGDAFEELPKTGPQKIHLHISNELVDMFPSEELYMAPQGELYVCVAIPLLTAQGLDYVQEKNPALAKEIRAYKKSMTEWLKQNLVSLPQGSSNPTLNSDSPCFPLTAEQCKQILGLIKTDSPPDSDPLILFQRQALPLALKPAIAEALKKHPSVVRLMQPDTTKIFCPHIEKYGQIIKSAKVSIIIDYGATGEKILNSSYRIYGSSDLHKYPFANPCQSDVTHDVDFTAMAESIRTHSSNTPIYYGSMGDLYPLNTPTELPESYSQTINDSELDRFRGEDYQVLIYYQSGMTPFPDLTPQDSKGVSEFELFRNRNQLAEQQGNMHT